MKKHQISSELINLEIIKKILDKKIKLELSEEATAAIEKCRNYLDEKIARCPFMV